MRRSTTAPARESSGCGRIRGREGVAPGEANLKGPAAEDLRQGKGESPLVRCEPPGNRFSTRERLANLGSRPGACFGASMPWQDGRGSFALRKQSMRDQAATAGQGETVVVEDVSFRAQQGADGLGQRGIYPQRFQHAGELRELDLHRTFQLGAPPGIVQDAAAALHISI